MLFEIDRLTDELKSRRLALALGTALMERSVPLPPKRWFAMLRTFTALPEIKHVLQKRTSHSDPYFGLTIPATPDEIMFIIRATALSGIDELCELVDVLDTEPVEIRDRFLTAASNLSQSIDHIISSAWLSDSRVKGFDGRAASEKLHRLRETAARWKNADMASELACAEAVMLDEYADDKQGALDFCRRRKPITHKIIVSAGTGRRSIIATAIMHSRLQNLNCSLAHFRGPNRSTVPLPCAKPGAVPPRSAS